MPSRATVGTAGGNKDVTEIWIGTAGGNKRVTEGWVGTSGGNKRFDGLAVAAVENPVHWTTIESPPFGSFSFAYVAVAATGGTEPYSYAWAKNGNCTLGSPTNEATVQVSVSGVGPWSVYCTVTDAGGTVVVSETIAIIH